MSLRSRLASPSGVLDAGGRSIRSGDVAAIRIAASLEPGAGGTINPYAYDGAAPFTQEMSNWLPTLRSPDTELAWDRTRMAARARDLVRNDGWARGAINRLLDAAIGAHFFPVPRPNWRALARRYGSRFDAAWAADFQAGIVSEWRMWSNDPNHSADLTGTATVTQNLRMLLRSQLIEGDSLAFVGYDRAARDDGAVPYATRLMVIDPDRLSNPYHGTDAADRRGGVQIDDRGAPVGYHVQRAHEYDPYLAADSMLWDYIPRFTPDGSPVMVHGFERERAGQHRGVGILHAVLGRFRMLNRYDATSLQAAMLRATIGFFMTSAQDEQMAADALGTDGDNADPNAFYGGLANAILTQQPVMMGGVRVPVLPPGEKLDMVSGPGHADDYDAFQSAGLRLISAATGQSSPEISNNFAGINYSSFRGMAGQAWRTLIRRRDDFAAGTAKPIYTRFVEEVCERFPELLPSGFGPVFIDREWPFMRSSIADSKWIGPGRGWIDPVKERQGEVLGLDAGFGTLEDTCADVEGEYWLDRLDQRELEVEAMKKRGLKMPNWAAGEPAQQIEEKPEPQ